MELLDHWDFAVKLFPNQSFLFSFGLDSLYVNTRYFRIWGVGRSSWDQFYLISHANLRFLVGVSYKITIGTLSFKNILIQICRLTKKFNWRNVWCKKKLLKLCLSKIRKRYHFRKIFFLLIKLSNILKF